jgi:hypothetical protein
MLNELINNQYLYYIAIMVLGIYMTMNVPSNLKELYKNNIFKIIVLTIVLSRNNNNMTYNVILSGVAIFISEYVVKNVFNKETFKLDVSEGGFKLSGVKQSSRSGESNVINITQSS